MSYLAISSIFSFVTCLGLGLFLLFQKPNNKPAFIWGILCVFASTWHIGLYIAATTKDYDTAFLGFQIANIGTIMGPIVHHHFVCAYLNLKKKLQLSLFYIFATIAIFINFYDPILFIGELKYLFNELYYIYWLTDKTLAYIIMFLLEYSFLLFYSFYLLAKSLKNQNKKDKNQTKFIIFGSFVGWLGGLSDFIPTFGIEIYPHLDILLGVFPLIIGYSIIKHKALNLNIVIRRGLVYSILVATLSIIYLIAIYVLENIFRSILGYQSFIVSILLAIFIAIIFTPLRNFIQNTIDQLIFKGSFEKIAEENQRLMMETTKKEKFKAVATLASGIAHEIKNPLQAIKTFTEYLPEKHTDKDFVDKFSKLVGKEVARIDDLVHQLLDYSKPRDLNIQQTNIVKLLDDTVEILSSKMLQNKIILQKKYDPYQNIFLPIDPSLIRQVLYNLIINAIEVMPNGGILRVKTHKINDFFCIQVVDTGSGISKKHLHQIFNPFFTRKDQGSGLGLAVTKTIMDQHRGNIRVRSTKNRATVFEITLPTETS